ncbi:hypothetical protein Lalb_Chr22g0361591 [Lupinus albus]|uniref:Uncharacterized protein n=1 Tax=Lupinus albus TaxID=3870 RepID=A0A6A4NNN8_LUPAL|nr:hypothetical protein Lalb_Chr22g0361591 [Lupinus albus]
MQATLLILDQNLVLKDMLYVESSTEPERGSQEYVSSTTHLFIVSYDSITFRLINS